MILVIRQWEGNFPVQFPRIDTAVNLIIEIRAIGVYMSRSSDGDVHIRVKGVCT